MARARKHAREAKGEKEESVQDETKCPAPPARTRPARREMSDARRENGEYVIVDEGECEEAASRERVGWLRAQLAWMWPLWPLRRA